jgi:hypothetical protein
MHATVGGWRVGNVAVAQEDGHLVASGRETRADLLDMPLDTAERGWYSALADDGDSPRALFAQRNLLT